MTDNKYKKSLSILRSVKSSKN